MKKPLTIFLILAAALLCACAAQGKRFDTAQEIGVVSREDGSGTRSAFVDLLGITAQDKTGASYDATTLKSVVTNSTAVMRTTVSGDRYAIGYLSFASLDESVKPLAVSGAAPTSENIRSGEYPLAREFLLVSSGSLSPSAHDFLSFILSAEGQQVVAHCGYVPLDAATAYHAGAAGARVVIAGSSSVAPILEQLRASYLNYQPNADIALQQSDSSTGISAVLQGICDIGMSSRALHASERAQGAQASIIARDGIAVIVNPENPIDCLTCEELRAIFSGEYTAWNMLTDTSKEDGA